MGIYWSTRAYHGRLLYKKTYQELQKKTTVPKGFLTQVTRDKFFLLHAPGICIPFGNIDPIIQRQQESVEIEHINNWLKADSKRWQTWNSPTEQELKKLDELVKLAAEDDEAKAGVYMLEIQWSSLCMHQGEYGEELKAKIPCIPGGFRAECWWMASGCRN